MVIWFSVLFMHTHTYICACMVHIMCMCVYILSIEPNLLTHTAHSIAKKGVKRRDLNSAELREIVSDLLCLVRLSHVIQASSDVLSAAVKRGLVSMPLAHFLGDEAPVHRASAWTRSQCSALFQKPRLFTPYYKESKVSFHLCTMHCMAM